MVYILIKCNKCGAENPDGSRFCENCGSPLTAEVPAPAAAPAPQAEPAPAPTAQPAPAVSAPAAAAPAAPAAQPVQPAYSTKPVAPPVAPQSKKVKKVNPRINDTLSVWGFIWTFIVMAIPVVNLVFILIWAFNSNTNKNRRHLAWAVIIMFLVGLALELCIYFFVPGVKEFYAETEQTVKEWVEIVMKVKSNPEIIQYYSAGSY